MMGKRVFLGVLGAILILSAAIGWKSYSENRKQQAAHAAKVQCEEMANKLADALADTVPVATEEKIHLRTEVNECLRDGRLHPYSMAVMRLGSGWYLK